MNKYLYDLKNINDISKNYDSKRVPISGHLREKKIGEYPYYGATKIMDYIDDFIFDGTYVLISEDGTVADNKGRPILQLTNGKFWVSNHAHVLQGEDNIETKFIFFALQSIKIRPFLTGSVQLKLSQSNLNRIKISYPKSRNIRKKIVNILNCLDEKISLIAKNNQTLEALSKGLFKSWFIDFDPVLAKADGRSTGLPNHISDLFPDSFEDSKLGEIPKDWFVTSLDELNEITMGQSPPGSTYNKSRKGLPFYQGKTDFGFRHPNRRVFCSKPKRFADESSTLLSVRAPVGSINVANESCCIGRGLASIKSKEGQHSFTYYLLNGIQSIFDSYNSEGTVFGAINRNDLSSISVINPSSNIREVFNNFASKIDKKISLGIEEINLLSSLRDTILPPLISGELRISHAEKMIEDAEI